MNMGKLVLYTEQDSAGIYSLRQFLQRSGLSVEMHPFNDFISGPGEEELLNHSDSNVFAIRFPDGVLKINPTVEETAMYLGMITEPTLAEYDVSIYGAGPAGLSAAVYAASEGLKTILVERESIGGQAGSSSLIENYLGFPEGISGSELA